MKKAWIIGLCIVALLLPVALYGGIVITNNAIAHGMAKELKSAPLPEGTILMDSFSLAGKLVGNGNGMQYFGAMLIKSEQTLEELAAYYADVNAEIVVKVQTSQAIECLEHAQLSFTTEITEEENYYIV